MSFCFSGEGRIIRKGRRDQTHEFFFAVHAFQSRRTFSSGAYVEIKHRSRTCIRTIYLRISRHIKKKKCDYTQFVIAYARTLHL